jgi:ATP-binding cassette subfamily F protein 3
LRILANDLQPDRGVVRDGHNVRRAYYAQHQADALDVKSSVMEEVYNAAPLEMSQVDVRNLLGAFLFSGDTVLKPIGVLSGGERSRIALAKMLLQPANVLLMDEPTNHLDIPAREMLENALRDYQGTAVVVSHDRYFISQVANKIVEVAGEAVTMYQGDYEYYREQKAKEKEREKEIDASAAAKAVVEAPTQTGRQETNRPPKLSPWKTKKAMEALEQEITEIEERIKEFERSMADPTLYGDGDKVKETLASYETSKVQLEQLTARWEELALSLEESAAN